MKSIKTLFNPLLRIAFALVVFLTSVCLISQVEEVKGRLGEFISQKVSEASGLDIHVRSAELRFPLRPHLENISWKDEKGQIKEVHQLDLWLPLGSLFYSQPSIEIRAKGLPSLPQATITVQALEGWDAWKALSAKTTDSDKALFNGHLSLKNGPWKIRSPFQFLENKSASFPQIQAEGDNLSLEGYGTLNSDFEIEDAEATARVFFSNGEVRITTQVKGLLFAPKAEGKFSFETLTFKNVPVSSGSGHFNARISGGNISGKCFGTATIADKQTTLDSQFFLLEGNILELSDLALSSPLGDLNGNIKLDLNESFLSGSLKGNIRKTAPLAALYHTPFDGALSFDATFEEENKQQSLSLIFNSSKIYRGDIRIKNMSGTAHLRNIFLEPKGSLKVNGEGAQYRHWNFAKFSGHTEIGQKETPFFFEGQGSFGDTNLPLQISSEGSWTNSEYPSFLHVKRLEGKASRHTFKLEKEVSLNYSPSSASLSPLHLSVGEGIVTGSLNFDSQKVSCNMQMEEVPLAIGNLLFPNIPLSGETSGQISLSGSPQNPMGHSSISWNNVRYKEGKLKKLPPLSGKFQADFAAGIFEIKTFLNDHPVSFETSLPATLSFAPLSIDIERNKEIQGSLRYQGTFSPIFHLLLPDSHRLSGYADADLKLSGTLLTPKVEGYGELRYGRYESLLTSSTFKDIHASIRGEDSSLILDGLTATDGSAGKIFASGEWDINYLKSFPFHASAILTDTTLINQDNTYANFDGQLELAGNTHGATLSGELLLNNGDMVIPERFNNDLPSLNITYSEPSKNTTNEHISLFAYPLSLDVAVKSKKPFSVSGKGLHSHWDGDLKLIQNQDSLQTVGTLKLNKGTFRFSGKTFVITEGNLVFHENPEQAPSIDVIAELVLDNISVKATLNGPISSPKLSFVSVPALSLNEILAQIMFDRKISEITPVEALQIGQVIIDMSEGNFDENLFGKLKRNIGIDQFDIKNFGEDEASLKIGKYFNGTLISLEKKIYTEDQQLSVETNLSKELRLQADISNNAENKMRLKWKHDY